LQQKIVVLVRGVLGRGTEQAAQVTSDIELIRSGVLDSLSLLQLFVRIQEEFEIDLNPACITEQNFATPSAIAEMLEPLVNGIDLDLPR